MLWIAYGGQGVFERGSDKVRAVRRSQVGDRWAGKPWNEFVQTVRDRSAEVERRSKR
jgi:hypothetical protein